MRTLAVTMLPSHGARQNILSSPYPSRERLKVGCEKGTGNIRFPAAAILLKLLAL